MKKVAFFFGREHHAQKLLPVINAGNNIIEPQILISDNATNVDPPIEFLHKYGVTSNVTHHAKDYISAAPPSKAVRKFISKVPADQLSYLPAFWMAFSARELMEVMHGFGGYLYQNRPDAVVVLHPQNFWAQPLTYLAKELKIKTYSLEEGIKLRREEEDLRRYSQSLDYIDTVFSWHKWNNHLYNNEEKVVITGAPHLDYLINMNDRDRGFLRAHILGSMGLPQLNKTILFAPPRLDLYRGNPIEDLREICKIAVRRGVAVVIKTHPYQGAIEQMEKVANIYPETVRIYRGDDTPGLISSVDAVISQVSTVTLEALMMGKQGWVLDFARMGAEQDIEGSLTIESSEDFQEALETLKKDEFPPISAYEYSDGKASERIINFINEAD